MLKKTKNPPVSPEGKPQNLADVKLALSLLSHGISATSSMPSMLAFNPILLVIELIFGVQSKNNFSFQEIFCQRTAQSLQLCSGQACLVDSQDFKLYYDYLKEDLDCCEILFYINKEDFIIIIIIIEDHLEQAPS